MTTAEDESEKLEAAETLCNLPNSPCPKSHPNGYVVQSPFTNCIATLSPLVRDLAGMNSPSVMFDHSNFSPALDLINTLPLATPDPTDQTMQSPFVGFEASGLLRGKATFRQKLFTDDDSNKDDDEEDGDDDDDEDDDDRRSRASSSKRKKNEGKRRTFTISQGRIQRPGDSGSVKSSGKRGASKLSHSTSFQSSSPLKPPRKPVSPMKKRGGINSRTISSSSSSSSTPNSGAISRLKKMGGKTSGASSPGSATSSQKGSGSRNPCNCKRSKCLKLYCECFAARLYCLGCNCTECENTEAAEPKRQQAIKATLERNPNAFKPKIGQSPSTTGQHNKGCHCKKSGCLKRYCECFLGQVYCGQNCKCHDCKNYPGSQELLRKKKDFTNNPLNAPRRLLQPEAASSIVNTGVKAPTSSGPMAAPAQKSSAALKNASSALKTLATAVSNAESAKYPNKSSSSSSVTGVKRSLSPSSSSIGTTAPKGIKDENNSNAAVPNGNNGTTPEAKRIKPDPEDSAAVNANT